MDSKNNTNNNELPDISSVFEIDENSIPDKIIEKDPDSSKKIENPVLTSDEAKRFLPEETQKKIKKEEKKEKRIKFKNKLQMRLIMGLSAALVLIITVLIVSFIVNDSKRPVITTENPAIESISRYYTTEKVVTVNDARGKVAVFFDNDYSVHHIEIGQSALLTLSDGSICQGKVFAIKEIKPGNSLITRFYSLLYDTLPSTSVWAVYIEPIKAGILTTDGDILQSANITTKTVERTMTVPSSAICMSSYQYYVWVYTPSGTLERQDVNIGIESSGKTEITAGLEPDDDVAVSFSCEKDSIHEGIKVKVKE